MTENIAIETPRQKFVRLRDALAKIIPDDFVYIPRGAERYLKVVHPKESGNLLVGTIFPLPLSDHDRVEALKLASEYGITIPEEYLKVRSGYCCHQHKTGH
ncbi:MAG: hypothetical protein WCV55_02240 [Candidatus Paceibacterota bacterium]